MNRSGPVWKALFAALLALLASSASAQATKLYFHDAVSPNLGTLPGAATLSASTPNVTAPGAGINRDMDETIGTAQASVALTTAGQTAVQRNWFRRFLSRPLSAQTLPTGAWTIQGGASEDAGSSNMLAWGAVIKVWRPSTGATVATLLDNPLLGATEPGTGETNISTATGSIAGVAVNEGDILVIELWSQNAQQNTQTRTNTVFYDGTTEGSTTSNAAFLQAPGVISFHRSFRQSSYRFFDNANSTAVGTALAAQDAAATLASTGAAFRLRMLVHVVDVDLGIGAQAFKLQFADKGTGTCAAPVGGTPAAYTDVTAATVIAYNNNAAVADGAALAANINDPTHGSDTVANQTYEESNNFTNTAAISGGQDGKWDFALVDNGAAASKTFCFRVVKSTGAALETYLAYPEVTTAMAAVAAGGFNAYDTSTAAGAISGNIKTKIAGSTVSVDMIALNTARDAIATTFTGTVRIEVLNASDNSGALDANGCRSSWTLIQTLAPDPAFAGGDSGRKTVSFSQANSYPNVRLRITYPAGAPTVTGCSTDNFALRPNAFTSFTVSDNGNWTQPGTTRALDDIALGTVTHKAGRPFSVRATAVNAAGTPATTTNYAGAPTPTLTACAGAGCSATPNNGTLTLGSGFAAGVLASDSATYDNAGAFQLQLVDSSFAAVDASDGSTASELNIVSPIINVGRFIPDHFVLDGGSSITPRSDIVACSTSGFTYLGERMDLRFTLRARSFGGSTDLSNYTGALARLALTSASAYDIGAIDSAAPTLLTARVDTSLIAGVTATWSSGVAANIAAPVSISRNATPDGPYGLVRLGIAPSDADGVTLAAFNLDADNSGSNERAQIGNTTALRFGRLRLENAVGSDKLDLPIVNRIEYYNGNGFLLNPDDDCTPLSTANIGLSDYQGGITAANVPAGNISLAAPSFSDGVVGLKLLKPVTPPPVAAPGAVTLTIDLATAGRSYLQGNWGTPTYTANPRARAAFGLFGGQPNTFIYFRETY